MARTDSIRLTSFAGAEIKLEPLFLIDQLFWSPKITIYNFHSQLALLNRIQIDFISFMPSTHYGCYATAVVDR